MKADASSSGTPWGIIWVLGGAIFGAVASLALQRLFPESKPGDGFTLRWTDVSGQEKRLEFGDEEAEALRRAVEISGRGAVDVEVIEVRHGSVVAVQKAGQPVKGVVSG